MPTWEEFDRPGAERSAEQLRSIVRYQRWLIAVVLAQLVLWLAFILLMLVSRNPNFDFGMKFPIFLTLILGIIGGIFVFLTMWELRGGVAAVLFGLGTIVPCMGLLIITLVNGYATTELKKNGVKVGLFGASSADIENRPSPYDFDEDAGW